MLKFIIFFVMYFFSYTALADIFYCERTRLDTSGFSTNQAAESWFNKNITITADLNKKTATYKGSTSDLWIRDDKKRLKASFVRKMRDGSKLAVKFVFLANGQVDANLSQVGGYKTVGGAVYKCLGWNGILSAQSSNQENLKTVKFVKTYKRIYGEPSQVLDETINLTKNAQEASQSFKSTLSKSRSKILSRPTNKAVFGALPRSCNYRYTAWNKASPTRAIKVAQDGCNLKINRYNKLMNKNCQCSLFALNNTIFVDADYFIGEIGYVPIKAEIQEKEQRIIIKGTVQFGSPGKSINKFDLINDKNIKICKGYFNIKNKAKGSLFLDCFDGQYKGEGSFVNSGYDVEKRFMNGTAIINLNDNATMRVIYGTDAL